MKLWIKIFLSILILSLTTLFISIYFMVNNTHLQNVQREKERSLSEIDAIQLSITNSVDVNASSTKAINTVLSRLDDYYSKKEIHLILYQGENCIYNGLDTIEKSQYETLLKTDENKKIAQILEKNKNHYILISVMLPGVNNIVLIYARDISYIYTLRSQNIHLAIILFVIVTFVLGSFSYLYSKWITKPLSTLQKGAIAISLGDYTNSIPPTKDEFNDLANAFNNMAIAVENRTLELEERAREKQTFIDNLAHEMNTPLTSIQGYSEFLHNANASEEQRLIAADCIRVEAKRMKDIYNKLTTLTLAREKKLELAAVKIETLISDIHLTFFNQLRDKGILFYVRNQLDSVLMDKTLIHILISNLIKNSIQALPTGGAIHIYAYEENKRPVIEVSDNGHGIPSNKIDKVTNPFYRVDKSRSRKTGGAGLGLSICKNIAQIHDIELSIKSQEGIGTTIKIFF